MPRGLPSGIAVSYRQQYRRCGKPGCGVCAPGAPGHGPYWYAFWREGGRARSRYLGKERPPEAGIGDASNASVDTDDTDDTHVPAPHAGALTAPTSSGPAPATPRWHHWHVRTLGGFGLRRDGEPLAGEPLADESLAADRWARTRAAALFKWLLAAPGHRLTRDQATEALWPESPPDVGARRLRVVVHRLRALLDGRDERAGSLLRFDGAVLALELEPEPGCVDWLDADAFARAAGAALAGRDPAACRAALARYHGDYLPEDAYAEWAVGRREELSQLRLRLLLHLSALCSASGAVEEAMAALQAVLAVDRCHEDAALALMRLYAAAGRPAQALRLYRQLRAALRDELGLDPSDNVRDLAAALSTRQATEGAGAAIAAAALPAPLVPHNLPAPLTSFVGRQRELAALRRLLQQDAGGVATTGSVPSGAWDADRAVPCRLLTLTGPGGVGKTRLALALADELRDLPGPFPDGVWLVDLAALADPARVPAAVAAVLGVREDAARPLPDTLADALAPRRLLLILDNCEHLLSACATLAATLLAACPGLRILATSREALGAPGEQRWVVPALSILEHDAILPPAAAIQYEAVRLFMERARAVRPEMALDDNTVEAVLQICRQVAGLPLAVELAAGRVDTLSLREIATDLRASLRLLAYGPRVTAPRQHSMRATLEWSYRLLSHPEQTLLRRLAVFAGGWTRPGAEAVCAVDGIAPDDVMELLAGLMHKSLLVMDGEEDAVAGAGATRYRLLEPVRHYAAERLAAAHETTLLRDRHLCYVTALAETGEQALHGPEQAAWLDRLEREHDNLRAALRWAIEGGRIAPGLRLAGALGRFWAMRGHVSEGRHWLEELLARRPGGATEHAPEIAAHRAKALRAAGLLASEQADYARAVTCYDAALEALKALGDTRGVAIVLNNLGNVACWQGDAARARALYEESIALLRRLDEPSLLSAVLGNLGSLAVEWGDAPRASAWLEEALALQRELGDEDAVAKSLTNLAEVAQLQGDDRRAVALLEESLTLKRALGTKASIALSLVSLACVMSRLGDNRRAVALYLEGLTLRHELGDKRGLAEGLEGVAAVARRLGYLAHAAHLYGAAESLRARLNAPLTPVERERHDREVAATRAALGTQDFARAWAVGRALTFEKALAGVRDIAST